MSRENLNRYVLIIRRFTFFIIILFCVLFVLPLHQYSDQKNRRELNVEGEKYVMVKVTMKGDSAEKIGSFYILEHEVTFAQYDKFCEVTGRKKPSDAIHARADWEKSGVKNVKKSDLRWHRGDYPVINVSWQDAKDFCNWLSRKTREKIRLPYEKEWEFACINKLKKAINIDKIAWHDGNSDFSTHPIKKREPNSFGIYDMLGNVWEWCEDVFSGKTEGMTYRVVHGGSWINLPRICNCTQRRLILPESTGSGLGFRIVME